MACEGQRIPIVRVVAIRHAARDRLKPEEFEEIEWVCAKGPVETVTPAWQMGITTSVARVQESSVRLQTDRDPG